VTVPAHAPRRFERWLWTGPIGHFVGGGIDFAQALAHYLRTRAAKRKLGGR
jgi:hypothetical protein